MEQQNSSHWCIFQIPNIWIFISLIDSISSFKCSSMFVCPWNAWNNYFLYHTTSDRTSEVKPANIKNTNFICRMLYEHITITGVEYWMLNDVIMCSSVHCNGKINVKIWVSRKLISWHNYNSVADFGWMFD